MNKDVFLIMYGVLTMGLVSTLAYIYFSTIKENEQHNAGKRARKKAKKEKKRLKALAAAKG